MAAQVTGAYADIYTWENLYTAYRKAAKGKRSRRPAAAFEFKLEDNLIQLQEELATESYRPDLPPPNLPRTGGGAAFEQRGRGSRANRKGVCVLAVFGLTTRTAQTQPRCSILFWEINLWQKIYPTRVNDPLSRV